jgi:hypothetical protein
MTGSIAQHAKARSLAMLLPTVVTAKAIAAADLAPKNRLAVFACDEVQFIGRGRF